MSSAALQVQETASSVEEARQKARLEAITQILSQRTPATEIRTRKGRGKDVFKYTDGAYVIRTLNEALGHNWDFEADNEEIINWNGIPFEVRCRGRLTLRLGGQSVTKVQYGSQMIEFIKDRDKDGKAFIVAPVSIGDCFKGAATDAMKKCASLFGLALDLYDSDFKAENYTDDEPEPAPVHISDPRPKTLGELVTPKQLWMIRNMGREYQADVEAMCREKFNCALEEISRKAASVMIDALKAMNTPGAAMLEQEQYRAKQAAPANGPSRKAVFNRKHSEPTAIAFDAVCKRLVAHGVKGEEMLASVNELMASFGKPEVKTRYELDENSAIAATEWFERWAEKYDRKQQEVKSNA